MMKNRRSHEPSRRQLRLEALDPRLVFASAWHNAANPHDVNSDGNTRALDVLAIINTIDRFGGGPVQVIQDKWAELDPSAFQLTDGFYPDTNDDGIISAIDALIVINWFGSDEDRELKPTIEISNDSGSVEIMDEPNGAVQVVYTAIDGRSKTVVLAGANVERDGDVVFINALDGQSQVIAKAGIGILEADYSEPDGRATVSRFDIDGSTIIETYVCVPVITDPGWPIFQIPIDFEVPTPDVRQPISGFEEAVGAIVRREITRADETVVVHEYREASFEELLSLTVQMPDGLREATVNFPSMLNFSPPGLSSPLPPVSQTFDLDEFEQKLIRLLNAGIVPSNALTPAELDEALRQIDAPAVTVFER